MNAWPYLGAPSNVAIDLAIDSNGCDTNTTDGIRSFSSSNASCTLHDVQLPQSAVA